MTGGSVRIVSLILALGFACAAGGAPRVVDPASARLAVTLPAVAAQGAQLTALADAGRASDLAARLEVIARDATLSDVAQEWLLDRGLHALARIAPTPAARATVVRLASRRPRVYARIDPDHGERSTPLYDAGATARFVLHSWSRTEAQAIAATELSEGSTLVVDRYAAHAVEDVRDPVLAGIEEAFRTAPASALAAQRVAVGDALASGARVDALALILAERLVDPALFGLLFDEGTDSAALAAVPAAVRALDAGSALDLLTRASKRADVGSAALLAIGSLVTEDSAARGALFDALADPVRAPSAAAALARLEDPGVAAEVGRRLAAAKSEDDRRILVLQLKLDAGPAAREELARFAASRAGSPKLRQEVDAWLAR